MLYSFTVHSEYRNINLNHRVKLIEQTILIPLSCFLLEVTNIMGGNLPRLPINISKQLPMSNFSFCQMFFPKI